MASSDAGFNIPQRNNRSQTMDDSDSDYERENIRPRGLTGLQNLGNTCYLNSALQSLSNCPPLTQYFLDCESLIRPEKSPMMSRSYLKLITELWHKKRPSYVVPSGIVTGIKAVHPMFRGFTQQCRARFMRRIFLWIKVLSQAGDQPTVDAQEFLRCLMDQLHEELKTPVLLSDDSDEDDDDDNADDSGDGCREDNANNTNNARQQKDVTDVAAAASTVVGGRNMSPDLKTVSGEAGNRRPSFDSMSSQSELDYETCDSGLSSERSSNAGRDVGSSDENVSDLNGEGGAKVTEQEPIERSRKMSAMSAGSGTEEYYTPALDMVANTKEMKETANLLEKETEMRKGKVYMEGSDSREQGGTAASTVATPDTTTTSPKDGEVQGTKPKSASAVTATRKPRKPQNIRHDSIISQTFDGKILSSVRCLNCETVSTTKETFQDLSLPIPSKDHLHMLHSGYPSSTGGGVSPPKGGACGEVNQGWLTSMLSWMKSWFVGPTVTLQDCLAAFFSADELKGDNMYSCGKCKKLRNGLKYSKVLELPEILSIHLKRFRHEFYSSKISTYISFPLEGLDMDPYSDKDCRNEVTTYDLVAIICHHGTAGGGHYTAYCLNHLNGQWYEFDDQYVTEVDVSQVQNCEAYVLFYRKSNKKIEPVRQKIMEMETDEKSSILKFYISRQWLSRFQTFAEPGPITNMDFLCKHGGVPPGKIPLLDHLIAEIPQDAWEVLYNKFQGGMVCNHLFACKACENELERLKQRQHSEKEMFIQLNVEFQDDEYTGPVYAISMAWFREWEAFVREKTDTPPEAIDNSRITVHRNGQPTLRQSSDHGHLSKDMWLFLHRIYGGGPEILFRQSTGAVVKTGNATTSSSPPHAHTQHHPQQQQSKPTLASLAAAASASSPSSSSSSAYPQVASSTCTSSSLSVSSSTVPSTSPSPSGASNAEGTSLPPTSNAEGTSLPPTPQVEVPNVRNSHQSQPSPSRSDEIQLRADSLETHTSAQLKKDSQQDSQLSTTESDNRSSDKSPTTLVIDRQEVETISTEDETLQSNATLNSDNDVTPDTDIKTQSMTTASPSVVKSEIIQSADKSEEDDHTDNMEKINSMMSKSLTIISDHQDASVSYSSLNNLSLSTAENDSKSSSSTITTVTKLTNSAGQLSQVSQDSGIHTEPGPTYQDENNVCTDKICDKESSYINSEEQGRNTDKVNVCKDSGRVVEESSKSEEGGGGGDHVNHHGGSSVTEKPAGVKGRKKKKGKAMEVTRI